MTNETTYRVHFDVTRDGDDYRPREYRRHRHHNNSRAFVLLSRNMCLARGRYRFAIRDAFGDSITTPGYCVVALDGVTIAGSSVFGTEEQTRFSVVVGGWGKGWGNCEAVK